VPTVSIVLPTYNEEDNIPLLYERLCKVANSLKDIDLEFIFVDDASIDKTPEILKSLARKDPRVRTIRFSKNFNFHSGHLAGITCARGDAMMIMSADLQDPPEIIPDMIDRWQEQYEIVWAVRKMRNDPYRNILQARLFYWLLRKIALPRFPAQGADVVLFSRKVAEYLIKAQEKHSTIYGQISWMGFRQTEIEYVRAPRHGGSTGWSFDRSFKHAVDAFTSFSYFPIRFISYSGLLFIGAGMACLAFLIIQRLILNQNVSQWWWILDAMMIFSGIQCLMVGIVGEYVWRALEQIRKRPLYIIDEDAPSASAVNSDLHE
jgi:dolichol-phosphate mannosyltransferase